MRVNLVVNGKPASVELPPQTLLVHVLREELGLTGTHVGCDTAQCGACNAVFAPPGWSCVRSTCARAIVQGRAAMAAA